MKNIEEHLTYSHRISQLVSGHQQELRSAVKGTASRLVAVIRTNEALGYIDTKNLSSKQLYDLLKEHFGLPFKYRQFTDARNR